MTNTVKNISKGTSSFLLVLFLLISSSCNRQAEKAADFSDEIIQHQIEIIDSIDSLTASFRKYQPEEMKYAHVDLEKSISDGLRKLNTLKPFGNDSTYLQESRILFNSYRSLSENDFPEIIELLNIPDTSFTSDNQNTVFQIQANINSTLKSSHERFQKAQMEFGKKYRVNFEAPEEE